MRSPALKRAARVIVKSGFRSVATAYNAAICECPDEVLVFAHPDVYLPARWSMDFEESLAWLDRNDPNWGVLGLYGVNGEGAGRGFTYSTGIGGFVGVPISSPCVVRTLDEFVFVLRKRSGLTLDENIPGPQSQLCTTDVCLEAERQGLRSYVLPCFALHNSNRWSHLPLGFWRPYLFIRKKWRTALPIQVPYAFISAFCWPMLKSTLKLFVQRRFRSHRIATRVADPGSLYDQLRQNLLTLFGDNS